MNTYELAKLFFNNSISQNIIFSNDKIILSSIEEDSKCDFKQSFSFTRELISEEYLKSICAFANKSGGYLIFGITNDKEIVGINKQKIQDFDNKLVSNLISKYLSSNVDCCFYLFEVNSTISIGILVISEAHNKPIILTKNNERYKIQEGDIYYRYPAENKKIKFPELQSIVNNEIRKGMELLLGKVKNMIEIGPENAAILNKLNGTVDLDENKSLFVDKELLNSINLIEEGKLVEREGSPAFRIIGTIQPADVVLKVEKQTSITDSSIFICFLDKDKHLVNESFLEHIINSSSRYFPIFFIISCLEKTVAQAILDINDINKKGIKKSDKDRLLSYLRQPSFARVSQNEIIDLSYYHQFNDETNKDKYAEIIEKIRTKNRLGKKRERTIISHIVLDTIKRNNPLNQYILEQWPDYTTEGLHLLDDDFVKANEESVLAYTKQIFNEVFYKDSSPAKTSLRKFIGRIDKLLFYDRNE